MMQAVEQSGLNSQLKRDRDRFVAFAFASSDMLMELDGEQTITYLDGATRGFLGDDATHFIGHPMSDFLPEDQKGEWSSLLQELYRLGRTQQKRLTLTSPVFPRLPVMLSAVQLPGNSESTFLSLSILQQEMKTSDLQGRDLQTGLFSRTEYAKRAAERLKELTAEGIDAKMSLLDMAEIEAELKTMEPGQATQTHREVANYLRDRSAGKDTAGRIDEGVYSFIHDSSLVDDDIATGIRQLLQRLNPNFAKLKTRLATLDADINQLNAEDSSRAILYTLNRFAEKEKDFSFDSLQGSYQAMLEDTISNISSFKNTVENNAFDLAFQPIVDLRKGVVHHYEALVRLKDESSQPQFDNPFHFISFGEQTGLIHEFDLTMCHRALETLDRAHSDDRWPMLAINLSGKSLSSQIFMDSMHKLLAEYPHVRKQLVLEVTESAKIADMSHANNFLQELRRRGHMCCLDDFGVAESSFDYLRYLHVDYIKIDGSYVRENLNTTRGRHLLRAMVGMCRNLGMTTIAEMVEDETIASILWESGVHYGQGWLFGKPQTDESTLLGWNKTCPQFNGMTHQEVQKNQSV